MEKFSAFRVCWYFHHKSIHLIFLSGPWHGDTGTATAYPIVLIFVDSLIAISDTCTSSRCRISPYRDPFASPIYPGNHSDTVGLATRPCILHLSQRLLSYSRSVIHLLFLSSPDTYPQLPIPPLHRFVEHLFTYILGRTALFILGIFWISVEQATRKRGLAWNLWYSIILSWLFLMTEGDLEKMKGGDLVQAISLFRIGLRG